MRSGREDVKMLRWLFLSCIFPHLCTALNMTCNGTWDGDRTTCTISDAPDDPEDPGCEYQWMNSSLQNHVLANHIDASPEVKKKSIKDLVILGCPHEIIYSRSCLSEKEAYSVICKISCRRHDLFQGNEETSYHWVWGIVALVLLMVVVGMVICCCKFRDKALRPCSTGFMWTAVKQEPADVEKGNCSETSTTNMEVLQENTQN